MKRSKGFKIIQKQTFVNNESKNITIVRVYENILEEVDFRIKYVLINKKKYDFQFIDNYTIIINDNIINETEYVYFIG